MNKAIYIKRVFKDTHDNAVFYKLSPPFKQDDRIIKYAIAATNVINDIPETYIFEATEDGEFLKFTEIDNSKYNILGVNQFHHDSHELKFNHIGYTIVNEGIQLDYVTIKLF